MKRPEPLQWESDDDLKKWLLKEVPGLDRAVGESDPLELAYRLAFWLSSKATFSHKELLLDHGKLSPKDLLSGALCYQGGMWCGAVAEMFAGLLCLFDGIYASKWSYGLHEQNVTHVTNLVGTQDGKAFVFDAYLGYVYLDRETQKLIPFGELLHRIHDHEYESIQRQDFGMRRDAVTVPGDKGGGFSWCLGERRSCTKYEDRWVYHGANCSYPKLYAPGTNNWRRIEAERGDTPFDHFMLDLLLAEVNMDRWRAQETGIFPIEFKIMRELVYSLVRR